MLKAIVLNKNRRASTILVNQLSNSSKLNEYFSRKVTVATIKKEKPWERLACKIKDKNIDSKHSDNFKRVYNPEENLVKLQDEICEEMADSLARTGRKVNYYFNIMKKLDDRCNQDLKDSKISMTVKRENIIALNSSIDEFEQIRDELIIHRQSLGFTWKNQEIVEQEFPISLKRKIQ